MTPPVTPLVISQFTPQVIPPRHVHEPFTRRLTMQIGLIAIAAGLAIGLSAFATALAQARIGAAAMGAMAEKPELAGRAILLVAIPETLVILGFAVAAMLILLLPGT
jgi:V/A-type H+-transporting ATPase subunit K